MNLWGTWLCMLGAVIKGGSAQAYSSQPKSESLPNYTKVGERSRIPLSLFALAQSQRATSTSRNHLLNIKATYLVDTTVGAPWADVPVSLFIPT